MDILATDDIKDHGPHRIVGIGASAGGLKPVKEIVRLLPTNTNMSFVVVQHVGPDSILAEILQKCTTMPVRMVSEGLPVEKNCVYVNEPGHFISILNGKFKLTERPKTTPRKCIDFFFSALADTYEKNAVGVVLSGSLWDGSVGIKEIKAAGGLTLAQTPSSADFYSMPSAAIDTGCIDLIMNPEDIASMLASLILK